MSDLVAHFITGVLCLFGILFLLLIWVALRLYVALGGTLGPFEVLLFPNRTETEQNDPEAMSLRILNSLSALELVKVAEYYSKNELQKLTAFIEHKFGIEGHELSISPLMQSLILMGIWPLLIPKDGREDFYDLLDVDFAPSKFNVFTFKKLFIPRFLELVNSNDPAALAFMVQTEDDNAFKKELRDENDV